MEAFPAWNTLWNFQIYSSKTDSSRKSSTGILLSQYLLLDMTPKQFQLNIQQQEILLGERIFWSFKIIRNENIFVLQLRLILGWSCSTNVTSSSPLISLQTQSSVWAWKCGIHLCVTHSGMCSWDVKRVPCNHRGDSPVPKFFTSYMEISDECEKDPLNIFCIGLVFLWFFKYFHAWHTQIVLYPEILMPNVLIKMDTWGKILPSCHHGVK